MDNFNGPALIWPAALIMFAAFFYGIYKTDMAPPPGAGKLKNKRINKRISKRITGQALTQRPLGRMNKRDWLFALAITVIYGVLAFSFAGDTKAPQTFWRVPDNQPSLTLDIGKEVHLDNILLYTGVGNNDITLELSADGRSWRLQPNFSQYYWEVFRWKMPFLKEADTLSTRFIRMTFGPGVDSADSRNDADGTELGELALYILDDNNERALLDAAPLAAKYPEYAALFDEQRLAPPLPNLSNNAMYSRFSSVETAAGTISDNNNGMLFDEFYHARAAYDFVRNLPPSEITHPPLGKEIISAGIGLFGMTPFGWRFAGILFGVLMVPLLYILIKNLFDNTAVAVCGAVMFAFENMHFTQTHLATIDTYVVFFIIAMYLFMYRYVLSGYETPFVKTLPALFLCGLSFGLGVASKWTAVFAGLGLAALYITCLVGRGAYQAAAGRKKEYQTFLWRTLAASAGFFIVIPFIIYLLSYIPYTTAGGQPFTAGGLLRDMWSNQSYMLTYHGSTMANATNRFSSHWWDWLFDIRPILYYSRFHDASRTLIAAFTNPLVTIGGLAAVSIALYDAFRKRVKVAYVIVVGYLAQLVPWILIPRTAFAYHYFPSVVFLTLAICYIFTKILERRPEHRRWVYAFTGASVFLFFLLLPPAAGIQTPDWYSAWFARWLPGWPF